MTLSGVFFVVLEYGYGEEGPTVGVVIIKGSDVLLATKDNHPKKLYQLPGGQIEASETAIAAAVRELKENTGLDSSVSVLIQIPTKWEAKIKKSYGEAIFTFTCFVCTEYSGEAKRTDTATPVWIPISALSTLALNPNTIAAVDAAREVLYRIKR